MKIIHDQKLYRKLIPADIPLYLQPLWMDIFAHDWQAAIAISSDNLATLLWPYLEKSRYGLKKYGRIPFCPDNGPVFLNQHAGHGWGQLPHRFFSISIVDDRRRVLAVDKMAMDSWETIDRHYQYIDLESYPVDFQAVSRSKRKRLKKNSLYDFVRFDHLEEPGPLFMELFRALKISHVNENQLVKWKESLDHSFDHYLFGLRDSESNILSAQWLVGYQDTLYGWLAVRHPRFPVQGAREMLLWYIVQWARHRYKTYDLGGSSIAGVRQFNLEMGAKDVAYRRYIHCRPEWIRHVYKPSILMI